MGVTRVVSDTLLCYFPRTVTESSHRPDIGPVSPLGKARVRSSAVYLLPVIALSALDTIGLALLVIEHRSQPARMGLLYTFTFSLLLTAWVRSDRRLQNFTAPYEFEFFVFFLWPIFVPYYLVRTRGWIGLLFGVGLLFVFIAPFVIATILYVLNVS